MTDLPDRTRRSLPDWTRRRFLAASAAIATLSSRPSQPLFAQPPPRSAPLALETSGALPPRPETSTARPLRYLPDNRAFRIRNGREFFNRPLYAPGNPFRVDAGDLPEFSLYLPGHGGNLRIGISRPSGAKWLFEADEIVASYTSGQMLYTIHDPLLGRGALDLHLVTEAEGAGLHLSVRARETPPDLVLTWAFGGVSGRRGRCGGDIGCEIEPVSRFFQLEPQECNKNSYILRSAAADLKSDPADLHLAFPPGSGLHLADAALWNRGWQALQASSPDTPQPILVGSVPLNASAASASAAAEAPSLHLNIRRTTPPEPGAATPKPPPEPDPAIAFAARTRQLANLSGSFHVTTPDPFVDAAVNALVHASDALWDTAQQSLLGGAVASRSPLPGWRGPYALDPLGSHDRMRQHLRHWIERQNRTPLPPSQDPDAPVTGPPDPGSHLTRKDALLHSIGDLSGTPQNMNLLFFDALLRHLRWTGDLDLARETWPALSRHIDREYRLFRRVFRNPDNRADSSLHALPLYEAYACLWDSDNLAANGAGATQSTALNAFLNRSAATIARLIGEDPAPFEQEAGLILAGMQQLLWMPEAGAFANARDTLLPQSLHVSPALSASYHAIDSELPTPRQAWQIVTDRLSALPRIPVHGEGVPNRSSDRPPDGLPDARWFLLPSTDWLPSPASTSLIALAENMHFALALWQAGLPDDAFALYQGNLLDSMFQGLCPGNFHLSSQLDPHRHESQRDFADPIGITARALVEGLFGILPDLLRATLTIRPGFPSHWTEASLHHPGVDLAWRRDGSSETLEITSRLPHPVALTLILPARTTSDPVVLSNGHAFPFAFDPDATGAPRILLTNFPAANAWKIDVHWHGQPPVNPPATAVSRVGEAIPLPPDIAPSQIDDPQACLLSGVATTPGRHTVFVPIKQGSCRFWLPIALSILPSSQAAPADPNPAPPPNLPASCEAPGASDLYNRIDLSTLLNTSITSILTREYTAPRSPFCSLALPDHLIGSWTDFARPAPAPAPAALPVTLPAPVPFPVPVPVPVIDDTGLRSAGGTLHAALEDGTSIPFSTPADPRQPNCRLLSFWQPDRQRIELSLSGQARTLYLLMAGTTFPEASQSLHGSVTVLYTDGSTSVLNLRNPDTWWPIEQDYIFDNLIFRAPSPLPPRVDLRSGKTRLLNLTTSKSPAPNVPGGAATLLHLPLHPDRNLASLRVECTLYGVVIGLLAATLRR